MSAGDEYIQNGVRYVSHGPFGDLPRHGRGVESATDYFDNPKTGGLGFGSVADWDGQPVPDREWLVRDFVPAFNVTGLQGDGGTGKSLLAAQLAFGAATSGRWLGMEVSSGPAMYLSAEDDDDELHRRFADIARAGNRRLTDAANLHRKSLAGLGAVLAEPDKTGALKVTANFHALAQDIDEIRPVVLVLDTRADLFGGNEIDRVQVRQFITILRRLAVQYHTTIVLLGHPSLTGRNSGTGESGSTAWTNSVRSQLYLSYPEDAAPEARVLKTTKANYSQRGSELALRWEDGVFVAEGNTSALDGKAMLAKAKRVFLAILDEYTGTGQDAAPTKAPANFAEHHMAEGCTKKVLKQAMEMLLSERTIEIVEEGPPSRRVKRVRRRA